jgi:hypothetical protein
MMLSLPRVAAAAIGLPGACAAFKLSTGGIADRMQRASEKSVGA